MQRYDDSPLINPIWAWISTFTNHYDAPPSNKLVEMSSPSFQHLLLFFICFPPFFTRVNLQSDCRQLFLNFLKTRFIGQRLSKQSSMEGHNILESSICVGQSATDISSSKKSRKQQNILFENDSIVTQIFLRTINIFSTLDEGYWLWKFAKSESFLLSLSMWCE